MSNPPDSEGFIFNAARQLPAPERGDYLVKACAGDAVLRERIERLLEAYDEVGSFLENPAPGAGSGSPAESPPSPRSTIRVDPIGGTIPAEKPGDQIGRYKLLQQIGEGGCGVVYMAEQLEPVRRMVALKVIKLGMDTRNVIARFEAERQALALMDHPNIAKVLDAGATEAGRPYFVMELVKGIPVTVYCDEGKLSTRQRLELFMQICQAIQHAHQKGIIHRDIKPSNILVTLRDGVPIPKVIDFGIAKATTDQRLTDKTLFTQFGLFIGTPAYMSPEQAEMSELGIDTRSDIYSLGILLYELLTGSTPFNARELMKAGLDEIRRIIRDEEPVRPSTRISTLGAEALTNVAKLRQAEPAKLSGLMRGELDWIVMKALEKDRSRRYETANGLAMDVQRFLTDEPVAACPPSRIYLFQKLVRRNKLLFLATGAVALALTVGIAGTTWGLLRALHQKREAERSTSIAKHTTEFLTGMFASIDPAVAKLRPITVREILDESARTIATNFPSEPAVEFTLREAMGDIYGKLGREDLALEQFQAAVRLAKAAYGNTDHIEVSQGLCTLGDCLQDLGRMDEALAAYDTALQMIKRLYSKDDANVASALDNRALCLVGMGRQAEALPNFQAALAMRQRLFPGDHPDIAASFNNVALGLAAVGRSDEALTNYEAALKMDERIYKGDHPAVAQNLDNIAACLGQLGRADAALEKCEAALAMRERIYKGDHPDIATGLNSVGRGLSAAGRAADALPKFEAALSMWQRIYPGDHPSVARALNNLADCLSSLGRPADALPKFKAGLEMNQRLFKGDHPEVATTMQNVSACLVALGRMNEALPLYQETLAMRQRIYKGDHPDIAWSHSSLAFCFNELGRPAEALPEFEAASQMYQRLFSEDRPDKARTLHDSGLSLKALGRWPEALAKFETALAMRQRLYKRDHANVAASLGYVAESLVNLNRLPEAATKYQEAIAMLTRLAEAQPANNALKVSLALTLRGEGDLKAKGGEVEGANIDYRRGLDMVDALLAKGASSAQAGILRMTLRLRLGLEEAEVVVFSILPGSQAEKIGLQPGDILLHYAGQKITSAYQFMNLQGGANGNGLELEIRRADNSLKFTATNTILGAILKDRTISAK